MSPSHDLPFEQALSQLRISGSVLLFESYATPWSIDIPDEAELRHLAGVGNQSRVIPFHLVRFGSFDLTHDGMKAVTLTESEVAICPGGKSHTMSLGNSTRSVPFREILRGAPPGPALQGKVSTSLLCGVFIMQGTPLNPLLAALPPVLRISTNDNRNSPILSKAVEMLSLEVGRGNPSSFSAHRLLEVFCAEAILAYRKTHGSRSAGWFQAIDDSRIGKAVGLIHRSPGADWTVSTLAASISISPSRFAARFREVMGLSVMAYVSQCRMNMACQYLRDSSDSLGAIAERVGYQDIAAFSRAFKSAVGHSPASWRKSIKA